MKKYLIPAVSVFAALTFVSCKSAVTAQDVMGQEEKAMKSLREAQEEMVELAQMKEQYSVDGVKARIKELEKERSKIDKDIKKLEDVEHSTTAGATEGLVSDLKSKSKGIESKISDLKEQPKENWAKSIETINQEIKSLEQEVQRITANIDNSAE